MREAYTDTAVNLVTMVNPEVPFLRLFFQGGDY